MPNTLVLGATGITGRRITSRLAKQGCAVRAASRKPAAGYTVFDWTNRSTYAPALADVSAMYLVPEPFVVDPSAEIIALLDIAKRSGVRKVVLCTSLGVSFPHEPANSGRRAMERAVAASGLSWTLLRPGGFMQNFSEGFLLQGVLRTGGVVSATGTGAVCMVDADDIADVAVAALLDDRHAEQTYHLTGPEPVTFTAALASIGAMNGRHLEHRTLSSEAFTAVLVELGMPPAYAAILVRDQEAIRDGHAAAVSPDVEAVLGRAPGSFAEFVRREAHSWRKSQTLPAG